MRVAVAGATGAVGIEMMKTLEQRKFPVDSIALLASPKSAGTKLPFRGKDVAVQSLDDFDPRGVDVALFSAGSGVSKVHVPRFVEAGAVVVDNSSAFRMDPGVPLVVPEINPEAIRAHRGVIANPNCTTIIFLMAVYPIHRAAKVTRAIVSTYQAVSGKGARAMAELEDQIRSHVAGTPLVHEVFPHPILSNCIPQVDSFDDEGHTLEEMKVVRETRKIVGESAPAVIATCVRVPVPRAHSESIVLELERALSPSEARAVLRDFPGVAVVDEPKASKYPLATLASHGDDVLVGRIRRDPTSRHGLALWAVGDQLRKGAALNAVQIAELLGA